MYVPLHSCNRTTECHRDGRSVAHAPSAPDWVIGWAGLLALGSLSDLAFPGLPSGDFRSGSPITVAGAAPALTGFPFHLERHPTQTRLASLTVLSRLLLRGFGSHTPDMREKLQAVMSMKMRKNCLQKVQLSPSANRQFLEFGLWPGLFSLPNPRQYRWQDSPA